MGPSLRDLARRVWMSLPTTAPEAPALARFLGDWPPARSLDAESADRLRPAGADIGRRDAPVQAPPILRWLPSMAEDATRFCADFVRALCSAAGSLDWRQTYSAAEVGTRFLQNYGWTELLRPHPHAGALQISCGALVLGPDTLYPAHRHEAEEIYLPLVGTAEWRHGGSLWRAEPPGSLIHHPSEEPHAMRTGEHPLLAMYLWRSTDLRQNARLDPRSGE